MMTISSSSVNRRNVHVHVLFECHRLFFCCCCFWFCFFWFCFSCFLFFLGGGRVQISMIDNRRRLFPLLRQSLFVVLPRLRWCSQRRFLAQYHVATLLGDCFEWLQHCSNIATLSCAKNRRCESSRVTSPLGSFSKDDGDRRRQQKRQFLKFAFFKTLSRLFQFAKNVKGRRGGLDVKAQLKGVWVALQEDSQTVAAYCV